MQLNVPQTLRTLNHHKVEFLMVGGMHFLFRHQPILTYDLDIWINDSAKNRSQCMHALNEMKATWGETEQSWGPVASLPGDWLLRQPVFSVLTCFGPLDIFRAMAGLGTWFDSAAQAVNVTLADGTTYRGLSDKDMLTCQEVLSEQDQKLDRIRILRAAIRGQSA